MLIALVLLTSVVSMPLKAAAQIPSAGIIVQEEQNLQMDWVDAYIAYLNQFQPEGYDESFYDEYFQYSLIDINQDGILEMFLISYNEWFSSYIVYFDGNEAKEFEVYRRDLAYIPGQNLMKASHSARGHCLDEIYTFDGSEFVLLESGEGWWWRTDANGELQTMPEYYWNGDETVLTEEEYDQALNAVFDVDQELSISGEYTLKAELIAILKERQNQQQDWKKAYIDYLYSFQPEGYDWESVRDWYRYSLIDIDGNGIPEMFLVTDAQWIPGIVVYYDGYQACEFGRRYGSFFYIPGQNLIRVEWFVKGRQGDEIYSLEASGLVLMEEGFHTWYDGQNNELDEPLYVWNKEHIPVTNYMDLDQVTEEEYDQLLNSFFDVSQSIAVTGDFATREELLAVLGEDGQTQKAEIIEKYYPYPTIAIRSVTNNCYLQCDIGARRTGALDPQKNKYEKYDSPDIRINAAEIGWYEMFNLVKCAGDEEIYALQSDANRQFISKAEYMLWKGLYARDDFIEKQHKIRIHEDQGFVKLQFVDGGDWIIRDGDSLTWGSDESKAEKFEIIYLDDNLYNDEELAILTSSEWFNIDGKGVGYWNIQDDIGGAKTEALETLGYTIMKRRWKNSNVISQYDMQCAVGVKLGNDRIYDVVVTFQGTGGDVYGNVDLAADIAHSVVGNGNETDGMHLGYTDMVNIFMELEGIIVAHIDGDEITYRDLLKKAKSGQARFTILGHSMGGAMAQIYAIKLVDKGIPISQIRGRTFNPALAIVPYYDWPEFHDWVNLCVTSDSVANGLVTGSLAPYGVYRIGKTIWLYDDEPDKNNTDRNGVGNIVNAKHEMDKKLLDILWAYAEGEE